MPSSQHNDYQLITFLFKLDFSLYFGNPEVVKRNKVATCGPVSAASGIRFEYIVKKLPL